MGHKPHKFVCAKRYKHLKLTLNSESNENPSRMTSRSVCGFTGQCDVRGHLTVVKGEPSLIGSLENYFDDPFPSSWPAQGFIKVKPAWGRFWKPTTSPLADSGPLHGPSGAP
uniref:Uncharacterized protein n=1 Tax=Solanum tuberosum TaxID=4113 RepID=M1DVQ2_SOLTU